MAPSILSILDINTFGLTLALFVVAIVIHTVTRWKMYKHFGKSDGFCVLGIFFPLITDAICAFDDAVYQKSST